MEACKAALKEIADKAQNAALQASALHERLQHGELPTADGLSFLEAKNHLLLSYNIHVAHLVLQKLHGAPTAAHPSRERLVYLRAMLDKAKPIDAKLKYQIDKLVKAGVAGALQGLEEDPLMHRPQPGKLVPKLADPTHDGADGGDDSQGAPGAAAGLYEVPKLSSVPYFEDDSKEAKAERKREKEQKKLQKSAMMRELRDEFSDRPTEIYEDEAYRQVAGAPSERDKEIQAYEEENFTRLVTRKTKKARPNTSTLADLLDFGSSRQLQHEEQTSRGRRQHETMSSKIAGVKRPRMAEKSLKPSKRRKMTK